MIAIHDSESGWSQRWLQYCEVHRVPLRRLNCYRTDVIEQLRGVRGLMWHFDHWLGEDLLAARSVLLSAQQMGLAVFPDLATCWHFDDKLAQKYLLEAVRAPLVPTYAFYRLHEALEWVEQCEFPVVAKLRRGAGSYNVRLLHGPRQARRYCRTMFGRGLEAIPGYLADVRTKAARVASLSDLRRALSKVPRFFRAVAHGRRSVPRERGYVLFQQFVPGNKYDTRVAVVGDKAWAFTRDVRADDFRASGSGSISYDPARISPSCLEIGFAVAEALHTQSIAFDFVRDGDGRYLIVEVSYGYEGKAVYDCPGYWDAQLQWHPGHIWPEDVIIANFLKGMEPNGSLVEEGRGPLPSE